MVECSSLSLETIAIKGILGQAAVVEVGLVGEGRAEIPEATGVCVGRSVGSSA